MADTNKVDNGNSGDSVQASIGDLVSLEEETHLPAAPPRPTPQDSVLNMAHVFEEQLEQMTTWKHQLASQMELLRRDGVKLLEKQKNLAIERRRVAEEREAVTADRTYVQKLHQELEEENKKLAAKGEEISRGLAELAKLSSEKDKWGQEVAAARSAAEGLLQERARVTAEIEAGQKKLTEFGQLQQRSEELSRQTAAAEENLKALQARAETLSASRASVEKQIGEAAEREKLLAEREAKLAAQESELAASLAGLESQRRELEESRRAAAREREELAQGQKEFAESSQAAAASLEEQRASAQEQSAEAKAALEGLNEARARQEERWTSLEARAAELAAAEELVDRRVKQLEIQEQAVQAGRKDADEAQGNLLAQQTELIAAERGVAAALAEAEKNAKALDEERAAVALHRAELEKKLDLMEGELAEQFETVAKQTRRLTERRAELDARRESLEKDAESLISAATAQLRQELENVQRGYAEKVRLLEEQVRTTEVGAGSWKSRQEELEKALATAAQESTSLKQELAKVNGELISESQARIGQAEMLAEQLMRFEKETAEWQRRLDVAVAENGAAPSSEQLTQALEAAAVAREELRSLTSKLEEVGAAREDLERRLAAEAARAAEGRKQAEQLSERLAKTEAALAALKEKKGAAAALDEDAAKQVQTLEAQRQDLFAQLFAAQDALKRQTEEVLLAKNVMEGEILTLRSDKQALEAQGKTREENWKKQLKAAGNGSGGASPEQAEHLKATTSWHRERLLRQARNLRAYKKQVRESKELLATSRDELAKQREQLRTRKENLEQVKRLLEKQEMVMARKLADHNALKTVAAVGIFVIMILGSTFLGVYKFVNPTYRSEALVQLTPRAALKGADLQAWMSKQAELAKTTDVTYAAWKILRSPEEHYAMHDVREVWLATLDKTLSVHVENGTLFVRYSGPQSEGVSQVCNAIATAYTTPGVVPASAGDDPKAAGGKLVAKAAPSLVPSEDRRLMISLSTVAVVMFVSLVLVILFRLHVTRQLKEIDQMADEADLADLKGEMA